MAGDVRNPRAPGLIYTALSLVLFVLVGVVALSVSTPPPPTIAEFAPQAVEQINDAPVEQTSRFGQGSREGAGEPGSAQQQLEEEMRSLSVDVPRVRRCVGDPPRQTEDPQSPPCVPYWEGSNGGATARGVTANEVRVALPALVFEQPAAIARMTTHFNRRFEFYGRRITLQIFTPRGNLVANPDPAAEQADAADVENMNVLASLGTGIRFGGEHHYYEELARRKIISVGATGAVGTDERIRQFAPYQWATQAPLDTMMRGYAEFVCKVLAGKPPIYAGPESSRAPEREFGVLYTETDDGSVPDLEPLRVGLARCGIKPLEVKFERSGNDGQRSQNAANAMLQLKLEGVTSVNCWCSSIDLRETVMPSASAQAYDPEWLVSTYGFHDIDSSYRQSPAQDQASRVLGVRFDNKLLAREDMPWFWALKDTDPAYDPGTDAYYHLVNRYSQLLLLASGIQLAGPRLTPETFAEGLYRTRFPNPGAAGPPYYQAWVGFEGRSQSMLRGDGAMIWHNRTRNGTIDPALPGAVCYVRHGVRYGIGGWPREDPDFFDYTGDCL